MTDPFDKQELLEELDGDREFLEESVAILAEDAPRLLAEIRQAIDSGDLDAAAAAAHTTKSMVGNFCATDAHAAALEVETQGRGGNLPACRMGLTVLEQEVGRLKQALDSFLDEFEGSSQ
jgi:HPt (histidine-containing phosphotransfer) domain-containing protein